MRMPAWSCSRTSPSSGARDDLERERTRATWLGALSQEFQTLAEHSPDFIARLDPSRRLVYINQAGAQLLGQQAEQCVGKTFAELGLSRDTRDVYVPWSQAFREVLTTGAPRTFDAEVQTPGQAADGPDGPDGQVQSLHARYIPELGDDGTLQSVLVIATDVSALKHAEACLAEQASELETIFESQADGVGVYDLQGRFVRANRALRELLGLDADADYTALPFEERAQRLRLFDEQGEPLPFEQWPQWRVLRGEILAGASAMETGVRTLDGRQLWISITGAPLRAPDGQDTGVVLVTRDVTARRALEQRVAEQAAELEATFDAMADGVLVHDAQGRVLRVNQAYRELVGLESEPDYLDRSLSERRARVQVTDEQGHPIPAEQSATQRVLRGEVMSGQRAQDAQIHTLDGRDVWVNTTAAPIRAPDGQITGAVLIARDVTARRALEYQVAEQAAELEAIFDAMADGVVVCNRERHLVRANRAWQAMFQGYAEVSGMSRDPTFAALPFPQQVARWAQLQQQRHQYLLRDASGAELSVEEVPIFRALRGETLTGANAVDERVVGLDGRLYEASVSAAPIRDAAGTIVGALAVSRDVTAQRQLERQVREQAAQLEAIFEAMTDGVGVFDPEGRFLRANSALWQLFGLEADPAYTSRLLEEQAQRQVLFDEQGQPVPSDQMPHWRVLHGEILVGASAMEGRLQTLDGREVWVSTTGAPMRTPDGQIAGTVMITRDVTARRALEQQVAAQASQLEAIFASMTDGVVVLDAQGHVTRMNPAAWVLFGRAPDEPVPQTPEERARGLELRDDTGQIVRADQLPTMRVLRGEILAGDDAVTLQVRTHDGRDRTISLTGGPLRDAVTGQVVGAVGVVRDVTELQRVQVALAEQERLFRTLVEHSPDIIARFDRELRYLYVSPAIRQSSPLPEAAYIGKTNAELGWPEAAYAPAHQAIAHVFQTGEPETLEEREAAWRDPATARTFRAQILPERANDGRVESVLTVTTDITTLKRTEQQVREANASLESARKEEERRKQIAESLRGVLTVLNSTRSPREVFQYIVGQVEELLGSAAAVIYGPDNLADSLSSGVPSVPSVPSASPTLLRVQAAQGLRVGGRRPRSQQRLPFTDPAVEQVLASAQPVTVIDDGGDDQGSPPSGGTSDEVNGLATIPCLRGTLPEPYHALLVVPIRVQGGIYGCLLLFYTEPNRFLSEEVALAQAYADQVAQAITNARLQKHLEQEAATAERGHLARELHDTVTQEIYSASLLAVSLPRLWQTHRAEAEAALQDLYTLTQSAHAGLRALLLELRPTALEQLPLAETLRQLGAAMSARAGVPVAVDLAGVASPEPPLPATVKVACYRVAQEALTNAGKYARAGAIHLRLRIQSRDLQGSPGTPGTSRLELEIADDGHGFDPGAIAAGHFGLAMMRERTHAVGAALQITSQVGRGTRIVVAWPSTRQAPVPEREGAAADG
jgi:two-component system nitrate/nitrite sensor histidine kinase NarX